MPVHLRLLNTEGGMPMRITRRALEVCLGLLLGLSIVLVLNVREAMRDAQEPIFSPTRSAVERSPPVGEQEDGGGPVAKMSPAPLPPIERKFLKVEWVPPVPIKSAYFDLQSFDTTRTSRWVVSGELHKQGGAYLTTLEVDAGYIQVRIWYRQAGKMCEALSPRWTAECPIINAPSEEIVVRYRGVKQDVVVLPLSSDMLTRSKWGTPSAGMYEIFLPEN